MNLIQFNSIERINLFMESINLDFFNQRKNNIFIFIGNLTNRYFIMSKDDILDHSKIKIYSEYLNDCLLIPGDQYIIFDSFELLPIFENPSEIIYHCFIHRFNLLKIELNEKEELNIYSRNIIDSGKTVDYIENNDMTIKEVLNDVNHLHFEDDKNEFSSLFLQTLLFIKNPSILMSIIESDNDTYYFQSKVIQSFHSNELHIKIDREYLLSGDRLKTMNEVLNEFDEFVPYERSFDCYLKDRYKVKNPNLDIEHIETQLKKILNGKCIEGKSLVELIEKITNEEVIIDESKFRLQSTEENKFNKYNLSVERCYFDGEQLYMTIICLYDITHRIISQIEDNITSKKLNQYINRKYMVFINRKEGEKMIPQLKKLNKNIICKERID